VVQWNPSGNATPWNSILAFRNNFYACIKNHIKVTGVIADSGADFDP
jgi:hypothetical protein